MIEILKNWWAATAILLAVFLAALGYNAMTADRTYHPDRSPDPVCEYTAEQVQSGEITLQEYIDLGCD